MIRVRLKSKALFVLVAVFAGALLLATDAHAEYLHSPGSTGGRSSAVGGRGAVPGVCDPVRPPVIAPTPAPALASAQPAANTNRVAANEDGPRGKNEPEPEKPKGDNTNGKKSASAKTDSIVDKGGDDVASKPAVSKAKLASLEPKDKFAALFKAQDCKGCHSEYLDDAGNLSKDMRGTIADMVLNEDSIPENAPPKMREGLKAIKSAGLNAEDKALLEQWARE